MREVYHSQKPDGNINSETIRKGVRDHSSSVEVQGGRFSFKVPGAPGRKGGGKRGKVDECSNASRRRLMATFAQLDYEALVSKGSQFHWVTLKTTPEYWDKPLEVLDALERLQARLWYWFGRWGYLGAILRKEYGEKNGMLHFHGVFIGGGMSAAWFREAWCECLGYTGPRKNMVHYKETTDPALVAKYMCKYCSKAAYDGRVRHGSSVETPIPEESSTEETCASLLDAHNSRNRTNACTGGRWWYVWGKNRLPWAQVVTILQDDARAIAKRVRRIFKRWRIDKLRLATDRKHNSPGYTFRAGWTMKHMARSDRFIEFLRKSAGGFTILVPPDLLEKMVCAAVEAEMWHRLEGRA